jgi:transcriptional regulator with GAF, ATPase, and Fis domain/predicted ATPase
MNGDHGPREVLWQDGERLYRRVWRDMGDGGRREFLVAQPRAEHPAPGTIDRLVHEYGLKDHLDHPWALRPLELVRERGQTMVVFEPTRARPLDEMIGPGLSVGTFLRLGLAVTSAVARLHQGGLVHKDIKASHILIDAASGEARLTGFGIASRLPREPQPLEPPELIAGTLSHLAPEQTGRMNRSVDSRSDLYSLGVTFYHALTGSLPFNAGEPMEWVHCHIARKPAPPTTGLDDIPPQLAAIVMKLLAKTPEERYQTAAGVGHDLERCREEWERRAAIGEFALGGGDQSDRLRIPEKLYGRDREIETLLAAFDAAVASATPRLVLVSGYSGIGKSSVVGELHKALVPTRGLFAAGKFDQLKRDVPYAILAQAFRSLIRQLLGKPEAELTDWREQLRRALHPNGSLLVDLIPELTFVIGEQPPVADVPPPAAKARFQMTLRRLIGVFARAEHPLALFLDDLQWLDAATLDLLEHILVQPEPQHLLLVGAYRDNEVDAAHPLKRTLSVIRERHAVVQNIVLGPLESRDLIHWLADALRCPHERARPLARLVHEKTAGNPFFANQFLQELVEGGLVTFEPREARWRWDLEPIRATGYTDNVVDLMVGKLSRLPLRTQDALKAVACLGNTADTATLAMVHGAPEAQLHTDLWEALRQELIVRSDDSYRFVHDRVHEAAYSLIHEEDRAARHLAIGRILTTHLSPDRRDEAVFDIVGHFNRAATLLTSPEERADVAALNLTAGKRAKKAAAFASALSYLIAGAAVLDEDGKERHGLAFELDLQRAECEFLTGDVASAANRLNTLAARAATVVERAAVVGLQADVYYALQQPDRGLQAAVDCLRQAGLDIPLRPTDAEARAAYARILPQLDGVGLDALAALPLMTDPSSRAILEVLAKISSTAASFGGPNLQILIAVTAVDLTLKRGLHDGSCFAFIWLGWVAGSVYGDLDASFRFGQLGYELIEAKGLRRFEGYICLMFSTLMMPWAKHVLACRPVIDRTFEVSHNTGDRMWAVASRNILLSNLLLAGDSLMDVDREAERSLAFCKRAAFTDYTDAVAAQAALVRNLRGLTRPFGSLDDEQFDERRMETSFATQLHVEPIESWYWVRKLQARFLAADYGAALEAAHRAQAFLDKSPGMLECAEHELYSALTHAALCDSRSSDEGRRHVDAIVAHHRQLEVWARHCPENFANRALLVAAEIARIEGRDADAARLYEQAIRSARDNGFVNNEALALEIAARFYAGRGLDRIARAYLRDARDGYRQWGADGKVRDLETRYAHLTGEPASPDSMRTMVTPIEHFDLSTVLKVSQAVQGETDLKQLIATVMRLAVEHAGAERGLLILPHGDAYRVEAEARSGNEGVTVDLQPAGIGAATLPQAVLQYVLRTRERVLLPDAAAEKNGFAGDEYLRGQRARSVLCLPLLKQTRLAGIIYLENNLTPGAFTPARMALLEVLASDAAISLENARLYREVSALKDQLYKENLVLRDEVDRISMFEEIVGTSPALRPVLTRVAKVARTDSTVLITGETGTGKELVARAIHRRSARASRAFVSVNCAAVPRELIASELFGHEKGAFTGATQRRLGRFELAHGGTIFLDEVGELPMETQVALLRVLQEREFERVGGSASIRVDVRVVAATNRDLRAAIEAATFRSDLFYRLNVFPIAMPALRERADDIPLLVEYFIDRYARKAGKTIRRVNKRTLDHLRSYPWPGNVRELQNVIERSVIVCDTDEFTIDESWLSTAPAGDSRALSSTLAGHERTIIEDALRASGGRVFGPAGAAARLGIARSTLESKIRGLGIDKNRFRSRRTKS